MGVAQAEEEPSKRRRVDASEGPPAPSNGGVEASGSGVGAAAAPAPAGVGAEGVAESTSAPQNAEGTDNGEIELDQDVMAFMEGLLGEEDVAAIGGYQPPDEAPLRVEEPATHDDVNPSEL